MAASDVEYRCFVGGLAWATDDNSLHNAFSPFGEVLESKIILDRETQRSRGFGFVTFSSEQAMRDAIEGMNGKELDGRSITVTGTHIRKATTPLYQKLEPHSARSCLAMSSSSFPAHRSRSVPPHSAASAISAQRKYQTRSPPKEF
jgi:RNA recognition motif-containing protein